MRTSHIICPLRKQCGLAAFALLLLPAAPALADDDLATTIADMKLRVAEANTYYEDPFNAFGAFDYVMANPPFNVDDVTLDVPSGSLTA